MFIKICMFIIGLAIGGYGFIAGIREKDQEQKKIDLIAGAVGLLFAAIFALVIFVF